MAMVLSQSRLRCLCRSLSLCLCLCLSPCWRQMSALRRVRREGGQGRWRRGVSFPHTHTHSLFSQPSVRFVLLLFWFSIVSFNLFFVLATLLSRYLCHILLLSFCCCCFCCFFTHTHSHLAKQRAFCFVLDRRQCNLPLHAFVRFVQVLSCSDCCCCCCCC